MTLRNKIKLTIILLLSTNSLEVHYGQWNFNLSTSQSFSNNPFHSPIPLSTMISTLDIGLENEISSLGLGYYSNYSLFHNLTERNYYWHQFGIWNSFDNSMYGLYIEQRFNDESYEIYNYSNYNGYFKNRFVFEGINIFVNASLSMSIYSSLEDLDNILASSSLMLNKSFETKTTLIGGLNYNYKNYFSTDLKNSELVGDSIYSFNTKAFTSQISYFFRIAQSLTEGTGLSIQYSDQRILDGTAKTIRQLEYIYGDESQYFDDPISYNGTFLTIQFTQLLTEEMILRASANIGSKDYPSQGVYTDSGSFDQNKVRKDKLSLYDISITKYFYVGSDSQNTFSLKLTYQIKNNQSNSYWYNYKSNEISANLGFQF